MAAAEAALVPARTARATSFLVITTSAVVAMSQVWHMRAKGARTDFITLVVADQTLAFAQNVQRLQLVITVTALELPMEAFNCVRPAALGPIREDALEPIQDRVFPAVATRSLVITATVAPME